MCVINRLKICTDFLNEGMIERFIDLNKFQLISVINYSVVCGIYRFKKYRGFGN